MSNYCTCHIDKDNCFWCDYQVVKRSLETCRKANKRYRDVIEIAIHNMKGCSDLGTVFALNELERVLEGEE